MDRPANTTSHRLGSHGYRVGQLLDDYDAEHPGQVAAYLAARPSVDDTQPIAPVTDQAPRTNGIPATIFRAMAPRPAVAR